MKWAFTNPTLMELASVHALLGEKGETMEYLTTAADLGMVDGWHDYLPVCPLFESLRENPEFKAIVKRAKDEKAAMRARIEKME